MPKPRPSQPFFLVVADHSLRVFSIEGPMTDDRPWQSAVRYARERGLLVECGPTGTDRDRLDAEYRAKHNLASVPPGSIVRPRG